MVKKHIILRKRADPVQINLPNGRSFVSKWERISIKQLPINIKVTRNRTISTRQNNRRIFNLARDAFRNIKKKRKAAARQQSGQGLGSNFAEMGLNVGSKILGSDTGKELLNKGISSIPNIFKFGASKVKKKH